MSENEGPVQDFFDDHRLWFFYSLVKKIISEKYVRVKKNCEKGEELCKSMRNWRKLGRGHTELYLR